MGKKSTLYVLEKDIGHPKTLERRMISLKSGLKNDLVNVLIKK